MADASVCPGQLGMGRTRCHSPLLGRAGLQISEVLDLEGPLGGFWVESLGARQQTQNPRGAARPTATGTAVRLARGHQSWSPLICKHKATVPAPAFRRPHSPLPGPEAAGSGCLLIYTSNVRAACALRCHRAHASFKQDAGSAGKEPSGCDCAPDARKAPSTGA